MQTEVRYLLEIVKYILNGQVEEPKNPPEDLDWGRLIQLAQSYSILNYVSYWVDKLASEYRPDEERLAYLDKASFNILARTAYQIEATREMLETFEKEGVNLLGVKGVCTRERYPQSDLRTMGDLDMLYQPSQHQQMKRVMLQMNYELLNEGRKHDCYVRKPYLAVEMHRDLIDAESEYYSYYESIWERAKPKKNYKYIHELTLEDEYIYSLIHLVRHFQDGGIGIRFIMDVYVYNRIQEMDWKYVEGELRKLGLWEFFGNLSKLADRWFGLEPNHEDSEVLNQLEQYIVSNGTFGNARNAAAVSTVRNGRFHGLWKEIFPNLKSMQSVYVWLVKWPVLLPWAWVLRGFGSVTSKRRRKNIKYHVDKFKHGDREYGEELQRFFEQCGL